MKLFFFKSICIGGENMRVVKDLFWGFILLRIGIGKGELGSWFICF